MPYKEINTVDRPPRGMQIYAQTTMSNLRRHNQNTA